MKSMKLTSALTVAMIAGGIGFSSISANAAPQNQNSTGEVTFIPGNLTLDAVPDFDFGQQQITAQDKNYNAQSASEVQVTDLRGSSAGWELTVNATQLESNGKALTGSQINLTNGVGTNNNGETVTFSNSVLVPSTEVKVMSAAQNNGNGISKGTWQATDVTLHVPGTTTKAAGQYTATLTWTLKDVPTAP
ncbi:WxL domain-containing protein [Enterococcus faecalis]|nr:WxL domain-containing protein [Enterococcus faecalis]